MGFSLYDRANLATIAYASVRNDGTLLSSENIPKVDHVLGSGNYTIQAPYNLDGVQEPIFSDTDICLVTILDAPGASIAVNNTSPTTKTVFFLNPLTGPLEATFTIVILRTLITPP